MGIKKYKPTSPGRRNSSVNDFAEITTDKPYKKLLKRISRTGGRNSQGRITSRFRGGGARKLYRKIENLESESEMLYNELIYNTLTTGNVNKAHILKSLDVRRI